MASYTLVLAHRWPLTPSSLRTGGLIHPHPRVQVACNITCIVEHRPLMRNTPSACCKRPLSIAQCVLLLECRWMHALILNTEVTRLSRLLRIGWTHTLTLECRLHQMENMLHTYTLLHYIKIANGKECNLY